MYVCITMYMYEYSLHLSKIYSSPFICMYYSIANIYTIFSTFKYFELTCTCTCFKDENKLCYVSFFRSKLKERQPSATMVILLLMTLQCLIKSVQVRRCYKLLSLPMCGTSNNLEMLYLYCIKLTACMYNCLIQPTCKFTTCRVSPYDTPKYSFDKLELEENNCRKYG